MRRNARPVVEAGAGGGVGVYPFRFVAVGVEGAAGPMMTSAESAV